jgi:hypothetical protein
MYEVGKKRPDGKFNVWKSVTIDDYHQQWVVADVCDDYEDALAFASKKNHNKQRRAGYKVNQNA